MHYQYFLITLRTNNQEYCIMFLSFLTEKKVIFIKLYQMTKIV